MQLEKASTGFKAEYYNNTELKGSRSYKQKAILIHFWQEGQAVVGNIRANNFSARYTTYYSSDKDGEITFEVEA